MQTETPRISVIIPTLQEERYVATTLLKLRKVKPQVEVIVVDGGSEDSTVKVAREFTDKVYEITERGISKARNYGANHSNGDILLFLDADALPPNDFAEKLIGTFKDPKVVAATCSTMPLQPKLAEAFFFIYLNLMIRISCALPYARFKWQSRGEFFAVRKEVFQKLGGFNESLAVTEDYDLSCRLSEIGKLAFIKNLIVYESNRRIRKEGLLKTAATWLINVISYTLRGETISTDWEPVR